MPDHVHLILTPGQKEDGTPWSLGELMHGIKSYAAHEINKQTGSSGSVWQEGFFDRIVRDERDLQTKVRYIWENPVRKGLAEGPEDYPFSWNRWQAEAGRDGPPPG